MLNDIYSQKCSQLFGIAMGSSDDSSDLDSYTPLSSHSSSAKVKRAYRRALLKIHPDKHDQDDFEAHLRATEVFKVVNAAYLAFTSRESVENSDDM